MIAIICAMDKELKFFVDSIEDIKETLILDYKFIQGKINQKEVVIVKCGIGKMASGIVTALLIEHYNPQMIINSGIAGGYSKDLKPLDIICVNNVGCYDIDMSQQITIFIINGNGYVGADAIILSTICVRQCQGDGADIIPVQGG